METYLGENPDSQEAIEFLCLAEAGEVTHYEVLSAMTRGIKNKQFKTKVRSMLNQEKKHLLLCTQLAKKNRDMKNIRAIFCKRTCTTRPARTSVKSRTRMPCNGEVALSSNCTNVPSAIFLISITGVFLRALPCGCTSHSSRVKARHMPEDLLLPMPFLLQPNPTSKIVFSLVI